MEIKKNLETILSHFILISVSTFIFLGLFYSLFTLSYIKLIIFILLTLLLIIYLKSRTKNEKRKKEIYTGLILCLILSYSIIKIDLKNDKFIQIHLYCTSFTIYYYSEYLSVILYHFDECSCHSFLIDQSKQWIYTTLFSFLEYYIENYFFHKFKSFILFTLIGIICMIIGHFFRISALFTGKVSFTHLVSYKKKRTCFNYLWYLFSNFML